MGIVPEPMQAGYFKPGMNEQLRVLKIYAKFKPLFQRSAEDIVRALSYTSERATRSISRIFKMDFPTQLLRSMSLQIWEPDARFIDKSWATELGDRIIDADRHWIESLKETIRAGGKFPATPIDVVISKDGLMMLADGNHRVVAAIESGLSTIDAKITILTKSTMAEEVFGRHRPGYMVDLVSKLPDWKQLPSGSIKDAIGELLEANVLNEKQLETAIQSTISSKNMASTIDDILNGVINIKDVSYEQLGVTKERVAQAYREGDYEYLKKAFDITKKDSEQVARAVGVVEKGGSAVRWAPTEQGKILGDWLSDIPRMFVQHMEKTYFRVVPDNAIWQALVTKYPEYMQTLITESTFTKNYTKTLTHEMAHLLGISDQTLDILDKAGLQSAKEFMKISDALTPREYAVAERYLGYLDNMVGSDIAAFEDLISTWADEALEEFRKLPRNAERVEKWLYRVIKSGEVPLIPPAMQKRWFSIGNAAQGEGVVRHTMRMVERIMRMRLGQDAIEKMAAREVAANTKALMYSTEATKYLGQNMAQINNMFGDILKGFETGAKGTARAVGGLPAAGGRDALGRFVAGNQYQWTSETAPRFAKAGRDLLGRFIAGNRYQWTKETAPRFGKVSESTDIVLRRVEALVERATGEIEVLARDGTTVIKQLGSDSVKEIERVATAATGGGRGGALVPRGGALTTRGGMTYPPYSYEILRDTEQAAAKVGRTIGAGVIDYVIAPVMVNELQRMIRDIPVGGGEETFGSVMQQAGYEGTGPAGFAGEFFLGRDYESMSLEQIQSYVDKLDKINAVGVKTADFLTMMGGSLRGVFSLLEGGIAGIYDAFTGKELFSSFAKRTKEAFVEGFKAAGSSLGDVIYGREWQFDIAYGATEEMFGRQVAEAYAYLDTIEDVAEREAQYQILQNEIVTANVEELYAKRQTVLQAFSQRISDQINTMTANGTASAEELGTKMRSELARASKWVKENITWGTEINEQTVAQFIQDFENAGTLSAEAYVSTLEAAIAAFDIGTPEGFKAFLESMDEMYGDAQAGQIALDMMIVALQKLKDEFDANTQKIEDLRQELEKLTEEMEPLEWRVKEIDKDLINLGQAATNVATAFDLAIAINNLELTSDTAQNLKTEIAGLNLELSKTEMEMMPLTRALEKVQDEFDAVQDAISKAQQKLDDFLNAPIEGEAAYREERYQLERQIAEKERAIELAKRPLEAFENLGLTGSDTYKEAAAQVAVLEAELRGLQRHLDDLEYSREDFLSPIEHEKEMYELAQQGAEIAAATFSESLANYSKELEMLEEEGKRKQAQLETQQNLVDKKQEEIDRIQDSISLKEKELEIIEQQINLNNILLQNAKDRMAAEQEIKNLTEQIVPIKGDILGIEGMITAERLVQLANEYTLGNISKEQLQGMVDLSNQINSQIAGLTNEKTGLSNQIGVLKFDEEALNRQISATEKNNQAILDKMEALNQRIQEAIGGVNAAALSKKDLADIFGANIGDILSRMGQNIQRLTEDATGSSMEYRGSWMANVLKNLGFTTFQGGGIVSQAEQLALLHGPEAVIPMHNGAVPVQFTGAGILGGNTSINNSFGDMTFIVRDDNDIEELKAAILALRQGQTNFFSKANQYPERF
jgi:predicted  nucleic acid-binding Zn-ribbon protein